MITIQTAESALKNIYLDSVIHDINTKTNPFLTMVQKNARQISGKEARASIRYGNQGSVAAGKEGGDLPVSSNTKHAEIVSPVKNLYGTFQLSDKAVRAAQNNAGAFAGLLSGEMQNLVSTAQSNLNSMLYGNGYRLLGHTETHDTSDKSFICPARFIGNFPVGTVFWLYSANNNAVSESFLTVSEVDLNTRKVKYTGSCSLHRFDRLYAYASRNNDMETGVELNGIDSIFRQDSMYNLAAAQHAEIRPFITANTVRTGTLSVALDEDEIMKFFDGYEEYCQGMPADILLTHPNVRKAVFENLRDLRSNIDTMELAGGFKGFSFNGIPVYSDLKCKGGTLYALNSDSWSMHQLCDWTWLSGDDGSVLKQIDGKAGYSATLVKYADLICDKPFIQGKATNYSALKTVN